jgi:flagellar biosynthesis/type III secretory pathway protein FliH
MGRVIRAERSGPSVVHAEVYAAKQTAARILESAHAQADALRAAAVEAGRAAGHAEVAQQLLEIARLRAELLRRTEQEALRAVLLVAAELLGKTLEANPAQISCLLAPHLTRMRRAQHIVLKLHPEDAAWLAGHQRALSASAELEGSLELRPDPSITRGGCQIESNLGELDARIETRLDALAAALGLEQASEQKGRPA